MPISSDSNREEVLLLIGALIIAVDNENQEDVDILMTEVNKQDVTVFIECLLEWCLGLSALLGSATNETTTEVIRTISLAYQTDDT